MITIEELSQGLKDYLNTLGLTEEQVRSLMLSMIGNTGDLQTENKDNIVDAINDVKTDVDIALEKADKAFQSGVNVKNNMVQAINSKITVPDITTENTWDDIVSSVSNIKEAQGNALAADVLSGKTFTNSTGNVISGTIVNRGGAVTVTPTTADQTKAAGYYSGNITIKGDVNLVAANIISGKSIFGVVGTATISSLGGKRFSSGVANDGKGLTVTGLPFKPRVIVMYSTTSPYNVSVADSSVIGSGRYYKGGAYGVQSFTLTNNGFSGMNAGGYFPQYWFACE